VVEGRREKGGRPAPFLDVMNKERLALGEKRGGSPPLYEGGNSL